MSNKTDTTAAMTSHLPAVQPFSYVLIPAEDSQEVVERKFNVHSEEEMKTEILDHFKKVSMSLGQEEAFIENLMTKTEAQIKEQNKNSPTGVNGGEKGTPTMSRDQIRDLAVCALSNSTYEIVPVCMPKTENGYIGTSLYIDDAGAFKDLPVNTRASRLVQREIRGDAFLLSNHDDPKLDLWERVDCSLEKYNKIVEEIVENPSKSNSGNREKHQGDEGSSHPHKPGHKAYMPPVTAEAASLAISSKEEGNKLFFDKNYQGAIEAYSKTITLSAGDCCNLENPEEIRKARISAFNNRAQCYLELRQWEKAARDAREIILHLDPNNTKALYRLAKSLGQLKFYEEALAALEDCEKIIKSDSNEISSSSVSGTPVSAAALDTAALRKYIEESKSIDTTKERKKFSKMFS